MYLQVSDTISLSLCFLSGSSLIIIVSVVLLLFIVGLVSCVVMFCMKRQARAKGGVLRGICCPCISLSESCIDENHVISCFAVNDIVV